MESDRFYMSGGDQRGVYGNARRPHSGTSGGADHWVLKCDSSIGANLQYSYRRSALHLSRSLRPERQRLAKKRGFGNSRFNWSPPLTNVKESKG